MKKEIVVGVAAVLSLALGWSGCTSSSQVEKAVSEYLDKNLEKKIQEVMKKRGPAPELPLEERIKNAVSVDLGGAPAEGPEDAPITLIEFSDFQCPFCKRVVPTIKQLQKDYEGKIRIAFRQNPLPFHKNAMSAAKASLAAGAQGKFWEMHDALFEGQADLSDESILKIAQKVGLNMAKFKKDWRSTQFDKQIQADMEATKKLGATGTPAFFINGVALKGARPIESFKEVINKLLEMKGQKAPSSPAAADTQPKAGT